MFLKYRTLNNHIPKYVENNNTNNNNVNIELSY